jgi:endonuclease G
LGVPTTNDLIIRDCYALSSNDTTKFAVWVCYYVTCHEVDGDLDLERKWRNDPWLDSSETLEATPESQDDYEKAFSQQEYDRGHMAPLASFTGSRYASQVNDGRGGRSKL